MEIEIALPNGNTYVVDPAYCEIDWTLEDCGIGQFEYWGSVENQKELQIHIQSIKIHKATDETGEPVFLSDDLKRHLEMIAQANPEPWIYAVIEQED